MPIYIHMHIYTHVCVYIGAAYILKNTSEVSIIFLTISLINVGDLLILVFSRTQTVEVARADAERIKLLGGSEASAIVAVGKYGIKSQVDYHHQMVKHSETSLLL